MSHVMGKETYATLNNLPKEILNSLFGYLSIKYLYEICGAFDKKALKIILNHLKTHPTSGVLGWNWYQFKGSVGDIIQLPHLSYNLLLPSFYPDPLEIKRPYLYLITHIVVKSY